MRIAGKAKECLLVVLNLGHNVQANQESDSQDLCASLRASKYLSCLLATKKSLAIILRLNLNRAQNSSPDPWWTA